MLLALSANSALAFYGTAHLLVARRAQDILAEFNPEILSKALVELETLRKSNPDLTSREDQHPFTECASFADDVKGDYGFQSGWHFID